MSYGATSLTIAVASPTSVTVSWSVTSPSPPTFSWSLTTSGSGTMSGTTSGTGTTSTSGSVTVTGLTSGSNYGAGFANSIQLSLSGGAGSATIPPSNSVLLPVPPTASASFSGSGTSPSFAWSTSSTGGATINSVTASTSTGFASSNFSGSTTLSIGYNTTITGDVTGTYTQSGYSGTFSATQASYTSPTAYTVTWNYGSGSGSPSSSQVVSGSSVTAPSASLSGYTFNGWYTASSGGTLAVSSGGSYTPSANVTLYAQYTVIPTFPPATISSSINNGQQGTAYSGTATTTNMSYSGTWSSSTGLPPGLSWNNPAGSNTNTLSGTPTSTGTYSFSTTATNSYGSQTGNYTITISAPSSFPPAWSDSALANFVVNKVYSDGVTATNMSAYSGVYSVSAGSLPAGISLNTSTGAVTGTPTAAAAYSFTITATNTYSSVSQAFSGNVNGGMSYYDGSVFTKKTVKYYNGTAWTTGTVYVYNGSSWVATQ